MEGTDTLSQEQELQAYELKGLVGSSYEEAIRDTVRERDAKKVYAFRPLAATIEDLTREHTTFDAFMKNVLDQFSVNLDSAEEFGVIKRAVELANVAQCTTLVQRYAGHKEVLRYILGKLLEKRYAERAAPLEKK
ncbi:MAG: hypothetical protein KGH93_01725 [Patescibacteria group bacterium]|nr:hypothetical protein [Patescibacteria group bacterium]MDE1945896.1 hypothetical protein [Patescibacteria group bacterium]